MAELY